MVNYKYSILNDEPHQEILLGNDAFVRGMIEADVKVATAYPGSPTSGIGVRLAQIQDESGIYFEFSTNEKVALEIAASAAIGGAPACVFMKSVGLNVASDSFVQLSKFTLPGGLVIILGDDPGPHSSQNEQDNRHYAKLGKIPMLEPANVQEAKDYFCFAMKYSQQWQMPVVIRSTTRICHQTGIVKFGVKNKTNIQRKFDPNLEGGYIPLPATLAPLRRKSLKNLEKWKELADSGELLKEEIFGNQIPQIGFITSGHTYAALKSALRILGVGAAILKLGIVYPLPMEEILTFIQKYKKIKILEELDPIFETQIKAALFEHAISHIELLGKSNEKNYIDLMISEYNPSRLVQMISQILNLEVKNVIYSPLLEVPKRPPQLCPGCGHRTSIHVASKVIKKLKGYSMADIGCYTLGYLPPYEQGKVLYSMGSGVPSASGMSLALNGAPIMSFIGDSTFFHAGMPGIVNTLFNKHAQVLMIMDNGITAMTGHQPNPNTGKKSRGAKLFHKYADTKTISMDKTLAAWGVKFIKRVPAYNEKMVEDALYEAFEFAEKEKTLAVVIQEEPCALMRSTAERKAGTLANPYYIDHDICRNIKKCLLEFACPAIEDINGQAEINTSLCIGCGCCVQTCPMQNKPIKQMEDFKRI
ncbi:thiamine pyrophosphate-dependent enzyme [Promethearchaeum syntrophicum]|uniref:Indolepyruvate oxidoreductase subunit IorA n=1 Tax=Promethearchaeum syntrophicum TaxID=2594042 RepID=A0A5B9DEQ3_9ARCH|nr:thiamine pyrophosphate-dependent enzyme [Candidatus Prometheoarchaeum syntrophicum]QEE17515.1 Indolepyruvate oxidoreductase subunit IorA [Candidatus Prometheoarchaeum syntrophicum]